MFSNTDACKTLTFCINLFCLFCFWILQPNGSLIVKGGPTFRLSYVTLFFLTDKENSFVFLCLLFDALISDKSLAGDFPFYLATLRKFVVSLPKNAN